jgi:hypothetical protein
MLKMKHEAARGRVLAGLLLTSIGMAALQVQAATSLDSRTVPQPEWAQISGQIERTSIESAKDGSDSSLRAIVRPIEGGRVTVDFGPVATDSFQPKPDDYIHVRGTAIEREGQVTIFAHEVYAEGKVFSIPRTDRPAQDAAQGSSSSGASFPPSPAAPTPSP